MKRFFIAVSCVAVLICAGDLFAQNASLEFPTGSLTLSAPDDSEKTPTLSPVVFPHSLHFSYACKDCHHTWDGKSAVQSCATAGCHEKLWAAKPGTVPLDAKRIKSLAGAYHEVCRSCHRKEAVEQKKAGVNEVATGPIACDGCHPTPHSEAVSPDATLTVPMGTLTIEAPEGVEAKRGSVAFPHGAHFGVACQTCHHNWDGESELQNCTTSGCHDETQPSGTRNIKDPDNVLYYLAAFHNACVGCHRDMSRKAKTAGEDKAVKTGPLACNGCHS